MQKIDFELIGPIGTKATLGLIVLQADETLEQDFRRLFTDRQIALYTSRIPSGETLNTDTIAAMKTELPASAGLLPRAARFDAVGYGCTSGTTLIGVEAVAECVLQGVETPMVTDPLTAAIAALHALGVVRLGLVTPYVAEVAGPVCEAFVTAGFDVAQTVTFGEEEEARVARIAPASIKAAARAAASPTAAASGVDAIFLSCTNLRTLDVIEELEAELGLPVLSSNQVLAWHMAQLSGATVATDAPGRLFQTQPSGRALG